MTKRATRVIGRLITGAGILAGLDLLLRRELSWSSASHEAETKYRLLADHASDVIMRLNADLVRTYVSPASLSVLGFAPERLVGGHPRGIIHPDDWPRIPDLLATARASLSPARATYRVRHGDGRFIWMEGCYNFVPSDGGFVVALRDISAHKNAELQLEAANAELAHLARHDGLTGLANRRCFDEALLAELRRARRERHPVSLLLLDVDHFKRFNDCYGHLSGDECLRAVARAVRQVLRRPADLAARFGGEEFALLLPNTDEHGAVEVGAQVLRQVQRLAIPHNGNGSCGGIVTVSVGCATVAPSRLRDGVPDATAALALEDADRALYESKRTGRNRSLSASSLDAASPGSPCSHEAERLRTVAAFQASDVEAGTLDRIAHLAADLLAMPTAFVSLVEHDRVVVVGRHGLQMTELRRDLAFCSHTISGTEPLVLPDTLRDPRFSRNPLANAEKGIRFYAGAPLISSTNGQRVGALCVADDCPREPLDARQRAMLTDLARLLVERIERQDAPPPFPVAAAPASPLLRPVAS